MASVGRLCRGRQGGSVTAVRAGIEGVVGAGEGLLCYKLVLGVALTWPATPHGRSVGNARQKTSRGALLAVQ